MLGWQDSLPDQCVNISGLAFAHGVLPLFLTLTSLVIEHLLFALAARVTGAHTLSSTLTVAWACAPFRHLLFALTVRGA